MKAVFVPVVGVLLCGLFLPAVTAAQQEVTKVSLSKAVDRKPLSVGIELAPSAQAGSVTLRYRSFGQSEFRAVEMILSGTTAVATIPAEAVLPPSIEYYFEIGKKGAASTTHPLGAPQAGVLRTTVGVANSRDKEVRILSPEPGETVASEDLVVMISLYYASPAVDASKTRVMLDGVDVSSQIVISDDVIMYSPENFGRPLPMGAHFLKVELRDTTGKPYHTVDANFNLSTAAAIADEQTRFQTVGSAQLEVRDEALGIGGKTYVRGDVRMDATYRSLGFGTSIHLDNQNTEDRQPQNRFLVYGQTDFLRLDIGDAFPRLPGNIVSGKRVRGVTGALALGFFNLDVSVGQTERKVEGLLSSVATVYPDSAAVSGRPNNTVQAGTDYFTYRTFTPGTFTRNFLAVRPSFGGGETFQFGLTYMKSKDDVGSIKYGSSPQENVVVGTDAMFAADEQRIRFDVQAAMSLYNADIMNGSFTDADYDSLKANNVAGDKLKSIGTVVDNFITFNQYLFPTNPVGKGLPALAADAALSLNYLGHFFRVSAFHRGAAYKSFGNEYLQTDIAGFQIADNIRLLSNRIFAALSFERKNDNTANTKEVRTIYNNLNMSFSFLLGADLPTIQIGYGLFSRKAPIDQVARNAITNPVTGAMRPDSASITQSADDRTNRIFFGGSYDFVAGMRHSATMSVSIAGRKDNTFWKRDQNTLFLQTGVVSEVGGGLQTNVGIVFSSNTTSEQHLTAAGLDSVKAEAKFRYTILTLGAQARLFEDQLRLLASFNPTFGSFSRQELMVGMEYTLAQRHTFLVQADLFQNSGAKDDAILSFIYRLMF